MVHLRSLICNGLRKALGFCKMCLLDSGEMAKSKNVCVFVHVIFPGLNFHCYMYLSIFSLFFPPLFSLTTRVVYVLM